MSLIDGGFLTTHVDTSDIEGLRARRRAAGLKLAQTALDDLGDEPAARAALREVRDMLDLAEPPEPADASETGEQAPEPAPAPVRKRSPARARRLPPVNHGTEGGFYAHKRRGEDPCPVCREAERTARHARYRVMQAQRGWTGRRLRPIRHGTRGGYLQEHRRGLPKCDPCRTANRIALREFKRRRRHALAAAAAQSIPREAS